MSGYRAAFLSCLSRTSFWRSVRCWESSGEEHGGAITANWICESSWRSLKVLGLFDTFLAGSGVTSIWRSLIEGGFDAGEAKTATC